MRDDRTARWIAEYEAGATLAEIAAGAAVSASRVSQVLRRAGVAMRSGGPRAPYGPRVSREQFIAKNADIIAAATSGLSLEATGAKFGLTRERVRQICVKAGVARDPCVPGRTIVARARMKAKADARRARADARIKMCLAMARAREQGLPSDQIAAMFGCSQPFVCKAVLLVRPDLRKRRLAPRCSQTSHFSSSFAAPSSGSDSSLPDQGTTTAQSQAAA